MPSGILTPGLIFSPPFGELIFIFKQIWYSYRSSFPELSVLGKIAGVLVKCWETPDKSACAGEGLAEILFHES